MKNLLLSLFTLFLATSIFAQNKINHHRQLHIHRAIGTMEIDGLVNETTWQLADTAGGFTMVIPMDTSIGTVRTVVRMTYDDKRLYVGAVCYTPEYGRYNVESLRRDWNFGNNDNFLLFLDPFDDRVNGFSFGLNAAGGQWEGTMYDGGAIDLNWENKWASEVKQLGDRWEFEMAIPWKTLRYKAGRTEWGLNLSRLDLTAAEKSAWAPVPRQFPTSSLAYSGLLVFDEPPPPPSNNISVIPYVLTGVTKNFETNTPTQIKRNIGGDAKIAITPSLNLDLTVRPDFSQVEVDQQVTNLDRFELFFPERRQFFLENGDLFNNFGYNNVRPFFSRRIGLQTEIDAGARLSGRLNPDWRIGAMTMQTRENNALFLPAQNFSVLALQRKVFARSNITLLAVNKQNTSALEKPAPKPISPFNRVLGMEYNLASVNNIWKGKAFFMKSFSPNLKGKDFTVAANINNGGRTWSYGMGAEYVGPNFNVETGFLPRRNYYKASPYVGRIFFPKNNSRIVTHSVKLFSTSFWNGNSGKLIDNESYIPYNITFRNQSNFTTWVSYNFVELFQRFDPTNTNKPKLEIGSRHQWRAFGTEFNSTPKRPLTFGLNTRYGGYYQSGTRLNLTPQIGYRFQPYVKVALNASYNDIRMPAPWNRTVIWLIGPRLDVTFTNKLFFTGFFQYNDQLRNFNINTRLQWRYSPASDLFLVYTDNYESEQWNIRNRAFVLKFNYWWNL